MNKCEKVLVTGVTGNVGREVVNALLRLGIPARGAVLPAELDKARALFGPTLEVVPFDFSESSTWKDAYNGVTRVFLMRPPAIADVDNNINPSLDVAITLGVEHVVFLSLLGVNKNPIVPHYRIEKHILRRQIPYTFLRPSFFMQNLTGFFKDFIVNENILFCPAGSGKTSFIDTRDIAQVAALCLQGNSHLNTAYSLTGGEALDYYQVADMLTRELGRQITYTNPGIMQFRRTLRSRSYDPGYSTVLTGIFLTAKLGIAKLVTPDVERLLGRPPITMNQFIKDHVQIWTK